MKRGAWTLATLLALLCGTNALLAGGNANFVLGGRTLDDKDFWDPGEDQAVIGGTVSFREAGWPISLALGVHFGGAEETIHEFGFSGKWRTAVAELSFGVRKVWDLDKVHPYVGGGIAGVAAGAELEVAGVKVDDHDNSGGGYLEGGIFWRLGRRFNIGVDARSLFGTDIQLDFGGPFLADGDANYSQFGLVLGWGWPAD